jgi:hypothetical protein
MTRATALAVTRAVARTEMGGFLTNLFVENGFYKPVSLGLGNLKNGLKPGNYPGKFFKMG